MSLNSFAVHFLSQIIREIKETRIQTDGRLVQIDITVRRIPIGHTGQQLPQTGRLDSAL